MATMTVSFPGGKRADAEFAGFTIRTDQTPKNGGDGSAPQPFDVFLASIATCAGFYVKAYCDARELPVDGLGLQMHVERDHERHRVGRLRIEIVLPVGFPEKHHDALIRAADQCTVKKHMMEPPDFDFVIRTAETALAGATA